MKEAGGRQHSGLNAKTNLRVFYYYYMCAHTIRTRPKTGGPKRYRFTCRHTGESTSHKSMDVRYLFGR